MKKHNQLYWDINKILPYQRCFNFVNGERSIGKTYTTLKFMINKAIKNKLEFVYLVRTQDEKKNGIMEKAMAKVLEFEFPYYEIEFTNDAMYLVTGEEEDKVKTVLAYCLALSESVKIKKRSFPNVKYLIFDEYMLEDKSKSSYVGGWSEPDLLLSIYHTIDRENDKVICFLMGNNTSFYNPYHLHSAFRIPNVGKGQIWTSANVLFQWAESTKELQEQKSQCKFLAMIDNTDYGAYAKHGNYVDDNTEFIEERHPSAYFVCTIIYNGRSYGIWGATNIGKIYVDTKIDPSSKVVYALTTKDHQENTMLSKGKTSNVLSWIARNYKLGNLRFVNMEVKTLSEDAIQLLL